MEVNLQRGKNLISGASFRWVELFLLLLVTAAVFVGGVTVDIATSEVGADSGNNFSLSFSDSTLLIPATFTALMLGLHCVLCVLAPRADQFILPLAALLNGIGLVVIHRLDIALGRSLAEKQLMWTGLGVVVCATVVFLLRDYRLLTRYSYVLGSAGLVFLSLPLISPQPVESDARIWLKIGQFSIQPGEFAKVALVVFFAMLITQKRALFAVADYRVLGLGIPRLRDIAPIVFIGAVALAIMALTNDFGPALLLFLTVFGMVYVATSRLSWLLIGTAVLAVGGGILACVSDKIQQRIANARDPLADFYGSGNQLSEALFGLSSGGLGGTGLGQGYPQQIPLAFSDFILAAVGEELGLVGLGAVLVVFTMLQSRFFLTALRVKDSFGKLLMSGLAMILVAQVFIVVGGISGLIPMTGLTTPFMSAGGSALLSNYLMVSLALRVSDSALSAT